MGQDGARPGSMERGTFYKQSRYIAHLNENFYRIMDLGKFVSYRVVEKLFLATHLEQAKGIPLIGMPFEI